MQENFQVSTSSHALSSNLCYILKETLPHFCGLVDGLFSEFPLHTVFESSIELIWNCCFTFRST